jgi:predicted ABC-type ATPase
MLDKAFQRAFFNQVETLTGDELDRKIEAVQTTSKAFDQGSEAAADAKFMLRHMRRIRMEKVLGQKPVFMH